MIDEYTKERNKYYALTSISFTLDSKRSIITCLYFGSKCSLWSIQETSKKRTCLSAILHTHKICHMEVRSAKQTIPYKAQSRSEAQRITISLTESILCFPNKTKSTPSSFSTIPFNKLAIAHGCKLM